MSSLRLPPELYPLFLQLILRPSHIAICCLVNNTLNAFAAPLLYENICIFAWQKGAKARVTSLLRTLSGSKHLARYVKRLELRDFPFLMGAHAIEIESLCQETLANVVNLKSCSWTRDGSFSNAVIQALARLEGLRELEFNGHSGIEYNPKILLEINKIDKVTVIMPDRETATILPRWLEVLASNLRSLSLICKSSGLITDSMLQPVAPRLVRLEALQLTGCTRISAECVESMLAASEDGVRALRLEGLHYTFDIYHLSVAVQRKNSRPALFRNLTSLTVTFISYHDSPIVSLPAIQALTAQAPRLTKLNLHPPPPATRARLPETFIRHVVDAHGMRLRQLAINRVLLGPAEFTLVCEGLRELEQLYVTLLEIDMGAILCELRKLQSLWAVHLSFPFALDAAGILGMSNEDEIDDSDDSDYSIDYWKTYAEVAKACPRLRELGVQNRVWQVERICTRDESGKWSTIVRLGRRDNPTVAEQFLVMRI